MKKYISSLLLLLALVLPMLGMEAQAATTGTCGENVTWSLDSKGTLTISGTGDMADYASASDVPWYASRASVKSVVIKDGVTTIGDRAFYNCAVLTDVTVGSGVKTVGTFAFQGCSALGEIVLPASVTALEDSAFRGCTALETMTFGGNAPALGSYVFRDGASDMTVRYYEDSTGFDAAPWTDYYNETMHVGKWVVDTAATCTTDGSKHIDCTYCETTITETIPGGHNYVDGVCSVCKKVQLLDSGSCGYDLTWELDIRGVLTISGTGSMRDYSSSWSTAPWSEHEENIISVIIEEGVTTIGEYAFYSCSSLKEVTIPDSVTTIGWHAFYGCSSLTDVYITDIAAWLDIFYGDSDAKPLRANSLDKKLYLDGKLITNLVIPEGVTTIGDYAFYSCSNLESVTIPDSVTTMGNSVFSRCSSLTEVTIPDSVTTMGNSVFSRCSSLESVTIPDSVTTIGDYAFYSCSSLTEITIPDSVTEIGEDAFEDCSSLKKITIPESVTTIGEDAFSGCSSLRYVCYSGSKKQWDAISIDWGNVDLTGADIYFDGKTAPDIGCLTWKLDSNGKLIISGTGPMEDYNWEYPAPWDAASVKSVVIEEGVTSIGNCAFRDCTRLSNITIPESVTSIGYDAFYNCSSLTDVYITDIAAWASITFIGVDIWGDSYQNPLSISDSGAKLYLNGKLVTNLVIPKGVTTISAYAFDGCSSLTEITISDSVTQIGYDAFKDCSSLTDVYITDIAAWMSISFENTYANPLSNSSESKLYLDGKLITHLTIPAGVRRISNYAFSGCSSLKSVTIPDSVTQIGYDAFSNCSSLTDVYITDIAAWVSISFENTFANPLSNSSESKLYLDGKLITHLTIPAGVTSIGYSAFAGCGSLTSVTIPDSVTRISESAFQACGLTSVTIPDSVTEIYPSAFAYCKKLNSVTIPESVTKIDASAFSGCTSLSDVYYAGSEQQWKQILIASGNEELTGANIHYREISLPEGIGFTDVSQDAYYHAPVLWAVSKGITNGLSENTFGPDATCTRGQIVTFLWRANGSPTAGGTNPFTDVPADAWYTDAVLWAVEKGITTGTSSTTFSPDAGCTRGQVATFLWRSEGQPSSDGENIFTDIAPGTYYYDAVLWAVENGITNGVGEGLFAPDATCTRGQIVTFLYRAMAK